MYAVLSSLFTFFLLVIYGLCCELPQSFCGEQKLALENYPTCGSLLKKEATKKAPLISYPGLSSGKLYTLVMVDPDAPSPDQPRLKYWLHWLVTDIKGSDFFSGTTKIEYAGPSPPEGTHRYQFLLIEQKGKATIDAPSSRGKFALNQLTGDNYCANTVASFEYTVEAEKNK